MLVIKWWKCRQVILWSDHKVICSVTSTTSPMSYSHNYGKVWFSYADYFVYYTRHEQTVCTWYNQIANLYVLFLTFGGLVERQFIVFSAYWMRPYIFKLRVKSCESTESVDMRKWYWRMHHMYPITNTKTNVPSKAYISWDINKRLSRPSISIATNNAHMT